VVAMEAERINHKRMKSGKKTANVNTKKT